MLGLLTGIGSMIGGLGGIANSISNGVSAKENLQAVRETNAANFEMAKWQNAANMQNWSLMNEYNSPSQQMKRLEDAGLNPNLVYGNGSVGNSSSAPASVSAPKMEAYQKPMNMIGDLGGIVQGLLALSTMRKNEAEVDNIRETTRLTQFNQSNVQMDIALKKLQEAKTEVEREYWQKEIATQWRLHDAMVDNIEMKTALDDSNIGLTNAKMVNTIYDTALYDYRVESMQMQVKTALMNAQANLKNANTNAFNAQTNRMLSEKQMEKISADIVNSWLQSGGQLQENQIRDILINHGVNLKAGGPFGSMERGINELSKLLDNLIPLPF